MIEVSLLLATALLVAGATALRARREYLRSHPRAAARAAARVLATRRRALEAFATAPPTARPCCPAHDQGTPAGNPFPLRRHGTATRRPLPR
ncbi:hypothetical protein ACEZCY_05420 [Streptacidiphilus sp. N1-12]|uniref:Uncharacterized protein n=2 Tax=Streptacidiphilus alkalitolerans TaxID=3342712 RepID=A0ABV6W9D1_9ACTN